MDITIGPTQPERLTFSRASYTSQIDEGSPSGTRVVQVTASRAQGGEEGSEGSVTSSSPVTYALFSPTVEGALKIDESSGQYKQADMCQYLSIYF